MSPSATPSRSSSTPRTRSRRAAFSSLLLSSVLLVAVPGPTASGAVTAAAASPGPTDTVLPVAAETDGPVRYVLPLQTGDDASTRAGLVAAGLLARDFAPPSVRWGAGHRGVDILTAPESEVLAPQAGTVAFVGVVVDRPLLVIDHADGRRSTLEPVASGLTAGDRVEQGHAVGHLAPGAATHCAPATCLHWGVRRGETYVDPLALVGRLERVVLLPLAPS